MTGLATNSWVHQGCSGVVLPVGQRDNLLLPSRMLHGGRGSCGAGAPTWFALCLCGHLSSPAGSMHLSNSYGCQSVRKIKQQKPIFSWYVAIWWWERLLPEKLWPSCKFTTALQLSAGHFTNNYLKHLTHAVSWVSITRWLLSETSPAVPTRAWLPFWQLLHQIRSASFLIIAAAFWGRTGLCFSVCLIKSTCDSKIKLCSFGVFSLLVVKNLCVRFFWPSPWWC